MNPAELRRAARRHSAALRRLAASFRKTARLLDRLEAETRKSTARDRNPTPHPKLFDEEL